jgi:hypothetical protein
MYECRTPVIDENKQQRVIEAAREFMKRWRAESRGSKPYVRVKFKYFGRKGRILIDDFHYHIEIKRKADMVVRYRLLPCVRDLLRNSTDEPTPTEDGNLSLEGTTPDGQRFRVIIRPEGDRGILQSFYPT